MPFAQAGPLYDLHSICSTYLKGVTTMNTIIFRKSLAIIATLTLMIAFLPAKVSSHCDTMNGPVIAAAKKALQTGNVNFVLIWVQKKDEADIKAAFQKTLAVRKLNPDAQTLVDMYFFETLVRIHRAGEGVAYTGIKPAETEVEPGIAAADKSIESGSTEELLKHLDLSIHQHINAQYKELLEKKHFQSDDIEAGREYVKAYVEFIHYVERLNQAVTQPAHGHFEEALETGMHHQEH
jgi:hypothetical protein